MKTKLGLLLLMLLIAVWCEDSTHGQQPVGASQREATGAANKSGNNTKSPSKKWALLIGVNDYVAGRDLKYAVNDQVFFSQRLVEAGFSRQRIFSLLSGAKNAKDQPFKRNIEIRLQTVMGLAKEGDFVLVAFSGHGVHINGDSYICPADADQDSPKTTMIKVSDIYTALNTSKATFKLLVVDACRNIHLAAEKRSLVDEKESLRGIAKTFARPPSGILVLSSSAAGQFSHEDPKLKLGVFMAFLQYGLTGVADTEQGNRDGQVSLLELYKYTHEGTSLFVSKKHGTLQTPTLHGDIAGDFVLGVRRTVITNTLGMKLTLIPAGEFQMGSPTSEKDRNGDETRHQVKITKPFYLGVYEVTQAQYERVMGKNSSKFKGPQNPVEKVSWTEAVEFCRKLSELPAEKSGGYVYRLPTESEWEYACRAGTTTKYSFGDSESELSDYAWYDKNSGGTTHRVGGKKPTGWGLYDMHGNVFEWCQDWYGDYPGGSTTDPTGAAYAPNRHRVRRGGCWNSFSDYCRSAYRSRRTPDDRHNILGFRVLRSSIK
jgi:formylglycine-generating enzyme required for sulfatase activity